MQGKVHYHIMSGSVDLYEAEIEELMVDGEIEYNVIGVCDQSGAKSYKYTDDQVVRDFEMMKETEADVYGRGDYG